MIVHKGTGLNIGDPYKKPFSDVKDLDMVNLMANIEKRIKNGIASASGIRQIFDSSYGDEATDHVDGTSHEITEAAKAYVATVADSFAELMRQRTKEPTVLIGIDTRHTGPAIADVIVRSLLANNIKVKYAFVIPITEMAVYSRQSADGFIYISASHNPKGYNGLKLGFNDGRLLPRPTIDNFISQYHAKLRDPESIRHIIQKVNSVDADKIKLIYESVDIYREESKRIYADFADLLITGVKDLVKARERKLLISEEIRKKGLWIGVDYNGGARSDKEYLQSWGFNIYEINNRPRLDMVHDLSPVPEACRDATNCISELQKDRKIIAFLVYDTDGDRKNIVLPDGKGGAYLPGVQLVFALDVLCRILEAKCSGDKRKIGIVVNDATSSLIEQLSSYLDFIVRRVEVGEANVASAGLHMNNQGIYVPIMGEGSNGSVFDLELLVREPLHTVRTIIDFMTRPELVEYLLNSLYQSKIDARKVITNWYQPENLLGIYTNIIKSLPPSQTTDFFTEEGIYRGHDLPQDLFKDKFDDHFVSQLWKEIYKELKDKFNGEPIAEFVNYEGENEMRGRGNRTSGKGGYKIEFYVRTDDGAKRHVGWIWFRTSATERGVMRKGVSISHWEISEEASTVVKQVYSYINEKFNTAIREVEDIILKGVV